MERDFEYADFQTTPDRPCDIPLVDLDDSNVSDGSHQFGTPPAFLSGHVREPTGSTPVPPEKKHKNEDQDLNNSPLPTGLFPHTIGSANAYPAIPEAAENRKRE